MNYELIKTLCVRRGISTNQLCKAIDYTEAGFYRMMKKQTIDVDTLEKISTILNVHPSLFFKDEDGTGNISEPDINYINKKLKAVSTTDTAELIGLLRFKIITLESQLADLKDKV